MEILLGTKHSSPELYLSLSLYIVCNTALRVAAESQSIYIGHNAPWNDWRLSRENPQPPVHARHACSFFCGPNAKKSDALAKQQKKRPRAGDAQEDEDSDFEDELDDEEDVKGKGKSKSAPASKGSKGGLPAVSLDTTPCLSEYLPSEPCHATGPQLSVLSCLV